LLFHDDKDDDDDDAVIKAVRNIFPWQGNYGDGFVPSSISAANYKDTGNERT
jgi:hypothetical protein